MNEQRSQVAAPSTRDVAPSTSVRRTLASFQRYSDAEQAVDALSDRGFPVERVAIVGRELELVEQVTGRLDYPRAALRGAAGGMATGALIGWLFGAFAWITPLVGWLMLALYGAIFGAVVGAAFALVIHATARGRRDFASISMMRPQYYDLMVDEVVADAALRMLGWDN
jgi:hypothetical protein